MGTASSDPDLFDPPDPDRAGHHSPEPPTIGSQQDPAPPAPSTVGILPRILLPNGTSFPVGTAIPGGQALHRWQGVGNNAGARELNAFQKSEIPAMPTVEPQKWKGRWEEIQNFGRYVEQLVIWVGSVSDSFVIEIAYAVIADHEIRPEIFTTQQIGRGLRLLNILRQSVW